jgi:hypothetical protein
MRRPRRTRLNEAIRVTSVALRSNAEGLQVSMIRGQGTTKPLVEARPYGLDAALAAAREAGCAHLNLDGTVIRTDRIAALGHSPARRLGT